MTIIKANTLEEAMQEASLKLKCSVTKLQIEIVQYPQKGFLGFFKKKAMIAVIKKSSLKVPTNTNENIISKDDKEEKLYVNKKVKVQKNFTLEQNQTKLTQTQNFTLNHVETITPSLVTAQDEFENEFQSEFKNSKDDNLHIATKENIQKRISNDEARGSSIKRVSSDYFRKINAIDNFFQPSLSMDEIVTQIDTNINQLFNTSCFSLDKIKVSKYAEKVIYIEFTGKDSALLIGKDGYRYKALSYMLFNWINGQYGVQLRLEIAEFLKVQEEEVYQYIESMSDEINNNGYAQTKVFDGVLIQIALKKFRLDYPNMYVGVRTNANGLKYIIINPFRLKSD